MSSAYWPPHLPRSIPRPATTMSFNLDVSAARYADRTAIGFLGNDISYRSFKAQVDAFAGWLQKKAGVKRGDRVLLFLQNSPQWLIAYYGILRADAVVVPLNPMNREQELTHYITDSGVGVAVCGQDIAEHLLAAAKGTGLKHIVVAAYADYLPQRLEYEVPDWVAEPARAVSGCVDWNAAIGAGLTPDAPRAQPDDLCTLSYTSGTTGVSKGCMHTHQTWMHNTVSLLLWHGQNAASVFFGASPFYQVSGLGGGVHHPVFIGGMTVPVPRWERTLVLQLLERYRVTHFPVMPTAIINLLAGDDLDRYDLSSLRRLTSGGASMPTAVWERLRATLGLPFIEAYGLTETAAATHLNPVERPKPQCLGVPIFDTQSLIVDPDTLQPKEVFEAGEILVRGPQLFRGYWGRPEATEEAFVEIDGEMYFRTGDIGHVDDEGYFFMTDRRKRMINASGFKVWPAEIEAMLYQHPEVLEACVVGARDAYRGETVKAYVILRPGGRERVSEEEFIAWSKQQMAAYKYPRIVEFVDSLPKSPVGKILWREVQERANAQDGQ